MRINSLAGVLEGVHAPLREVSTISARSESINVLHVLRAPVGGLFRHVLDLARGQAERGHRVGIIADATTGGSRAEAALAELSPRLALGVSRVHMSRQIGLPDVAAVAHVGRRAAEVGAHVLHGHGAKGGAYARLARGRHAVRAYTPHGGSLHFGWGSPTGLLYLTLERVLLARTDLFLFESAYGRDVFRAKVGDPGARARVVHNGVTPAEFAPITTDAQASDLVFVGELRVLKGVDVLIQAIAVLEREGRSLSATIVGEGPDRSAFEALVRAQNSASACGSSAPGRPARRSLAAGSWSSPRAPSRCPISCWKRRRRASRSSPPRSAACPRFSGPMPWSSFRPATPPRWRARSIWRCAIPPPSAPGASACRPACASSFPATR